MLFSIGNLITFFAVLLILVIFRALDRNNRSLEKLKRFSDKIAANISALMEEKTAQLRELTADLQGSFTAGKELVARTRTVEEALQARTADVEGIRKRLLDFDKSLGEFTSVASRVDQTMKKVREESEIVDSAGKRILETVTRLDKIEKRLPELESGFASHARQSLEAVRAEVLSAVDAKVGTLASGVNASEQRLKDFSAYMARLEAREEQAEKERAAYLSRSLETFETDLNGRLSRAAQRGEALEDEVFSRLSTRIREDEATFAKSVQAIEMRLADYQSDVDYRVKALEDSDEDVEALRASLRESMEKMAAGVRVEMKQVAVELVAGWKGEIGSAAAAREEIHAGLSAVHAELEELKTRAYQDVEKGLSAFEDEFFADLRQRAAKSLERVNGFEGDLKAQIASVQSIGEEASIRLAEKLKSNEAAFARGVQAIELRLADYQVDVDNTRSKMAEMATGLAAGWQAEIAAAAGAREQVHAELETLKTRTSQELERTFSAMEAEFLSDLRQRAAKSLDKVNGFEGDLKTRIASSDAAVQDLRQRISAFEAEVNGVVTKAVQRGESMGEAVSARLAERLKSYEASFARGVEAIESRLADYQGDVDTRIKSLEESNGDVEAAKAAIHQEIETTVARARAEMAEMAASLASGWQAEVSAAAGAREQVRAELEELKTRASQGLEKDLSALENEFLSDLRQRTTQSLDKYQVWQADIEKRVEAFETDLKFRLASSDEAIQGLQSTLRAEVEKARKDSSLAVEKETAGLRETLDGAVRKMQREIETRLRELTTELETGRKDLTDVLEASRAEVVAWEGRARQQLSETEVTVAEKISRLSSEAESSIGTVREEFVSQKDELLEVVNQERASIKGELKDMKERISAFEGDLRRSAESTVEAIRMQMEKSGKSNSAALERELSGLREALESRSGEMHKEIDVAMAELAAHVEAGRKEAAAQAESALVAIREGFNAEKDELVAASSAEREALKKQIAEMGQRVGTFDAELSRTTDSTMEAIQVLRDSLHDEVEKARRESAAGVERDLASLREAMDAGSLRMQKEIETRMTAVTDEVETSRKEVSQLLEASSMYITAWETKTRQRLSESEAALARKLSSLESAAGSSVEEVRKELAAQKQELLAASEADGAAFKAELNEMAGKITSLKAELGRSSQETLDALRSQAELMQAENQKRLRDFQGETEARIKEYRQLMSESREKAEGMQEKLSAKIEESYRLMSANLADIDRRVKSFTAQTRLFERADVLKGTLEGSIEEMKKEITKLGADKAELAETELQLARTKKIADEVSAKLTRFLTEKRRIDEMEGDFKKLLTLSRDIDLKVGTLSGSHDALQQIQARIREFEEMGKVVETGVERLDKKQEIISVTAEGVDKNFQRLESMEKSIKETDQEAASLEAKVRALQTEYEALAGRKKDAESVMEIAGKLSGVIDELEQRLEKAQSSREWMARTETRFEEIGRQAQEQVRLLESIVKAETKKEKGDRGAPPMDKRETVVKLSHQGWSVQEISRVTQLSRGEVELILELAPKV